MPCSYESYCEYTNTKNIGNVELNPADIDLMGLVIIRIGERLGGDVTDIIQFLHGIFYDVDEVGKYIDFSKNQKFREEMERMALTGEHWIEYGEHRQMEKTKEAEQRAEEAEKKLEEERAKMEEERMRAEEEHLKVQKDLKEKIKKLEEQLKNR
ncbi:MAG: hypothetical protein PHC41_04210 [Lachnospiraceae bacterium]|nr:hypothetical protein [Lachnospiraceae bacterium]MDD3615412.1 hypothetical protein [Lachnospiraceae bacterium]